MARIAGCFMLEGNPDLKSWNDRWREKKTIQSIMEDGRMIPDYLDKEKGEIESKKVGMCQIESGRIFC